MEHRNDSLETGYLNEQDLDRNSLDRDFDALLLKKKIVKHIKDDKKIRDKQLEKE